jgi:hypothetical protein
MCARRQKMNSTPLEWTPVDRCGPSAGGASCPKAGQCCRVDQGVCVTGLSKCSALPMPRRYDGPPSMHADPYVRGDGDGQTTSCGSSAAPLLPCGPRANAQCPWSPLGPDLRCVPDREGHGASCVPATVVDGPTRGVFVWDGEWRLQ